jgi:hypothetical protein
LGILAHFRLLIERKSDVCNERAQNILNFQNFFLDIL